MPSLSSTKKLRLEIFFTLTRMLLLQTSLPSSSLGCYYIRSNWAVTRIYKLVTFTYDMVAAVEIMLRSDDHSDQW